MDFRIYVMSHERHDVKNQHTLSNFTDHLLEHTTLVVQGNQEFDYVDVADHFNVDLLVLPDNIKTLSPSIEFVGKGTSYEKFFIIDDDLKFAKRDELGSLYPINNSEGLDAMFDNLVNKLNEYPMVGVSARFGNNNVESDYKTATRQMCLHGLRKKEFMMVDHNRVVCRQDFDRILQYFQLGFCNWVDYTHTHDQPGSNINGGCSTYRTSEVLKEQAELLKELHPKYVTVVTKKTKSDWGVGGERVDVRIQWKKAYEDFNL